MLHGDSNSGKSSRVKQLDPDCETVYVRNLSKEALCGIFVYEGGKGQLKEPEWYTNLCEKCKDKEKTHILFLDEITNAYEDIQGEIMELVMERTINHKFKLPENCAIVAAGNELTDSGAANIMIKPLFNRFAHVYIKVQAESWLEWARNADNKPQYMDYEKFVPERKIHPAVYAYIEARRESALITEWTGEEPNATGYKWEQASKMLYKTKNPETLRGLIGEKMTQDFIAFTRESQINLSSVLNGEVDEDDIKMMDLSERISVSKSLSIANEEEIPIVRDFVKGMGKEVLTSFDSYWMGKNSQRIEMVQNMKAKDTVKLERGKE